MAVIWKTPYSRKSRSLVVTGLFWLFFWVGVSSKWLKAIFADMEVVFFVERTPSLHPKRRSSYYFSIQPSTGKIHHLFKDIFIDEMIISRIYPKQVLNSIIKGVCFTCLVKGTRCPKASRNCSMAPLWFVPQYDLIRRLFFFWLVLSVLSVLEAVCCKYVVILFAGIHIMIPRMIIHNTIYGW